MLVLSRKVGESVVIRHSPSGDEITVHLNSHLGNRVQIGLAGPLAFDVMRSELVPSKQPATESSQQLDCFVSDENGTAWRQGEVIKLDQRNGELRYDVRLTDGTVRHGWPPERVKIVTKQDDSDQEPEKTRITAPRNGLELT